MTSITLIIPTIRAFRNGKKVLSVVDGVACIMSVNYWRKPDKGIRLTIDRTTATMVVVSNAIVSFSSMNKKAIVLGSGSLLLWRGSNICKKRGLPIWWVLHGGYHLLGVMGTISNADSMP